MEGLTGLHRAAVTRVDGWRVRLTIPTVLGTQESGWAEPVAAIQAPVVGQDVWATFEGGDVRFPLWVPKTQPHVDLHDPRYAPSSHGH